MVQPIQVTPFTATMSAIAAVTIVLPCLVVANVVKLFVRLLVKLKYGNQADLLPGWDVAATAPKPLRTVDSLVNLLMTIDGEVTKDQLKARIANTLVDAKNPDGTWAHPKLRSSFLWFMGYKVMVVEHRKFDIEQHFEYLTAGQDGTPLMCHSANDLEDALERVANGDIFPGEPDMPPWKFSVFYSKINTWSPTGQDNVGDDTSHAGTSSNSSRVSTCFVLHIDHTIIDGGSLSMTVMPKLLDFDEKTDPTVMFQNLRPLSRWQRLAMDVRGLLLGPLAWCRVSFPGRDCKNDFHPLMGRGDGRNGRYLVTPLTIPLSKLTAIRKATDVKINPILTACLLRALLRFCKEDSSKKLSTAIASQDLLAKIASKWRWTIASPQSLWTPGDKIELKNRITGMTSTCTGAEVGLKDPLQTLSLVKQTTEEPSRLAFAFSLGFIVKALFNAVPVQVWGPSLSHFLCSSAAFTNVRGPDQVLKCLGGDVKQMTAYVSLWEGLGVGMVAGSCAGQMTVTFGGSKRCFRSREEVRQLQMYFLDEVNRLHEASMALKKEL